MAFLPTAAERASLRFSIGLIPFWVRYLIAIALFVGGSMWWLFGPARFLGLIVVFLGHLPLWVRKQRLAPGGATPVHEDVWVPVEDDWYGQVVELEARGAKWDTSPYDLSSGRGCGLFILVALAFFVLYLVVQESLGEGVGTSFVVLAAFLFIPLWFNGMRSNWNPSELKLKGDALAVARRVAEEIAGEAFEPVPLLALRQGLKGHYPVDARLMLRPRANSEGDFLGVQVQVAMNNVRGRDYPYLYCVILVKEGGTLPCIRREAPNLVYEPGSDEGVRFLVIRQYADRQGGWHTDADVIARIVRESLGLAEQCL